MRLEWEWGDLLDGPRWKSDAARVMRDGKVQRITSSWMGPIWQVLHDISRNHRGLDTINVFCPHEGGEDTGLRFVAGPRLAGEEKWPVIHCCFCKRCQHAMSQYDDDDSKPVDDYDAKAHEAMYP